jgi:hypothetical protein
MMQQMHLNAPSVPLPMLLLLQHMLHRLPCTLSETELLTRVKERTLLLVNVDGRRLPGTSHRPTMCPRNSFQGSVRRFDFFATVTPYAPLHY